ncbi:hypothetical protein QFC22_000967 [Naganishia vaughanmartiniae]|uniref:Uncharacterized protein n=1 Tax=Naganishia vaughanmartiniae TaxID=1424756 RepID=A0ACC2XLA7_9TREE|nr:hypothetical protein QFC22_000967 [Naganishia vaughanmartiniae]
MSGINPSDTNIEVAGPNAEDIFGGSHSDLTDLSESDVHPNSDTDEDVPLYRRCRPGLIAVNNCRAGYPVNRQPSPRTQASFPRKSTIGDIHLSSALELETISRPRDTPVSMSLPPSGRLGDNIQQKHARPISLRFGGIGDYQDHQSKTAEPGYSERHSTTYGANISAIGEVLPSVKKVKKRVLRYESDLDEEVPRAVKRSNGTVVAIERAHACTSGAQKAVNKGKEKRVEKATVSAQPDVNGRSVYRKQMKITDSRVASSSSKQVSRAPQPVQITSDPNAEAPFDWSDDFRQMVQKMMQPVDEFTNKARNSETPLRARVDSLELDARKTQEEFRLFRETTAREKEQSLREAKASRKRHATTKKALEEERKRSEEVAHLGRTEFEWGMQTQRDMVVHMASEAMRLVRIRQGYRLVLADAGQQTQSANLAVQTLETELMESRKRESELTRVAAEAGKHHKTGLALLGIQHAEELREATDETARQRAEIEAESRLATDDLNSKIHAQAVAMTDMQNAELSLRLDVAKATETFNAKIQALDISNRSLRLANAKYANDYDADQKYWNDRAAQAEKERDEWREKFAVLRSQEGSRALPPGDDADDDEIVVLAEDPKLTQSKRLAAARRSDPSATQTPSLPSGSQPLLSSSQPARAKKRSRPAETLGEKALKATVEEIHHRLFPKNMICKLCD